MSWIYLLVASCLEIGWPIGLKVSQMPGRFSAGVVFAVVCMSASGVFLWLAQREIPIGTAYAIWTGIGAAGTFTVGVLAFGDPAGLLRIASATFIVIGVIGLKLSHGAG